MVAPGCLLISVTNISCSLRAQPLFMWEKSNSLDESAESLKS